MFSYFTDRRLASKRLRPLADHVATIGVQLHQAGLAAGLLGRATKAYQDPGDLPYKKVSLKLTAEDIGDCS